MSNSPNIEAFADDLRGLISKVNMLPTTVAQPVFKRSLQKFGRKYVTTVQSSLRGKSGDKSSLHRRTGALARAFNHTVAPSATGQELFIWVDNSVKNYWRTHEEGKTISAKPGKMLAIPVGPALTPAGVSKYTSPRQLEGLFFVENKKGTKMLARAGNGKLMVYFLLKEEVTIPARLGLAEKWKAALPGIMPILQYETQQALVNISK